MSTVEHVIEEGKLFDAWLEGALVQLASVPIPGHLGSWFARLQISQLSNDERVRTAERFLGELRAALRRFRQTCERLPEDVRTTLASAGVGPDVFARLTADGRLESNPSEVETEQDFTTQEQVRAVIEETRRRAAMLVAELKRSSGFR